MKSTLWGPEAEFCEFMLHVVVDSAGCWNWGGAFTRGKHPVFRPHYCDKLIQASHFILHHVGRERQGADEAIRLCHNGNCVNPEHLEWMSKQRGGHWRRGNL